MDAQVITIANKLRKNDSVTGLDVWYKTKILDVPYKVEFIANASGTVTSNGQIINVLIPFSDKYKPYREWCKLPDKENYYTMSQGDYIFIDIDLVDDVNPTSIVKLKERYAPNAVKVISIIEVPKRNLIKYQLKVVAT